MKKIKVYIFNGTSRAAIYGIGTYINQLTTCLKRKKIEFELIHLYSEGNEVQISNQDDHRHIAIPQIKLTNKNSIKHYTRNIVYILREYIPLDPDYEQIFHLNFMTNEYLVRQLKQTFNCKVILTIHYTNWSFELLGNYKLLKNILKKHERNNQEQQIAEEFYEDVNMIKSCDKFVCVAQHSLQCFVECTDIDPEKGVIINNGLKDYHKKITKKKQLALKKKYLISPTTKIVFFAGRLDAVKGLEFLIKAFKKVLAKHPDSLLMIAGEGDFNEWLKIAGNCWTKIIFVGRLDKGQLYEFYQIADVGVVSSIHEEFGYVAIEMMMQKLPIIVSDIGGLSEIIEDNISGLKVPVRTINGKRKVDVNKLSEKMLELFKDTNKAYKISYNARKRFIDRYELNIFENNIINLYNNL